jgi:type I restriction enzyme S subunit
MYSADAQQSDLPRGWKRIAIDDLAESIQYGHTASATDDPSGPRFLRITDIQGGRVDWDAVPSCDIESGETAKYLLKSGDLVFARTGATTGKSFLIRDCPPAVFASYLIRLRMRSGVHPGFVYLFFQSANYWRQIEAGKRGIGQPNVNATILGRITMPVAPLLEQRRIVAKIEELFSDLDAGVAALERVRANLKRYRAAVLKAAVEGRLTEEWRTWHPATEPAAKLLERILTERRAKWEQDQLRKFKETRKTPPKGWKETYQEPCEPDMDRLGYTMRVPDGWAVVSAAQVAAMSLGKMLDREKHQTGTRLPYLRNVNVRWGWVDMSDLKEMFFEPDELDRFGLLPGDVLVCEGGEPGRAAVWTEANSKMTFQKAIHRVRCSRFLEGKYLVTLLEDYAKSGRLERFFTGSTIKHFTGETFATLPLPLPPLAEQAEIVAEVDRRLSVAHAAETQVEHALQRAARLRQAILKRAFEGKLVEQDPTDEPAAILMEGIPLERPNKTAAAGRVAKKRSFAKGWSIE